MLPSPPYIDPSEGRPPPPPKDHDREKRADATVDFTVYAASTETNKPLPSRPVSSKPESSESRRNPDEDICEVARKIKQADRVLRKRPSFVSLRKSGSRIFRFYAGDQDAPPPPMPQIPVDIPTPKLRRPVLRPFESARSARSSHSSKGRIVSISRPMSSMQAQLPPDFHPCKVPFVKPAGPPHHVQRGPTHGRRPSLASAQKKHTPASAYPPDTPPSPFLLFFPVLS
ncbi:hypothetical protein N0V86_005200 [Didymella sp. IMI 355093]|nr:hypothetical protein N0V86_005200 [Didymella sp. IMI 355093]